MMSSTLAALSLLAAPLEIDAVWLAFSAGDVPTAGERFARLDQSVRVHVVVEAHARGSRKRRLFADVEMVRRGRRVLKTERWPAGQPAPEFTFFRVEADPIERGVYDNTGTMEHAWHPEERASHPAKWHWCPIDVVETDTQWSSAWSHRVDATGTTTEDYKGLGTMRFAVHARLGRTERRSPGRDHRDAGGLLRDVATLRVRRDDTAVGYMTELINVPYVYGSSSTDGTPRGHQAERAVGADCADLVVYGWRRSGRDVGYTWSQGLKSHTRRVAVIAGEVNGSYRTADGRPLIFGKDILPGDVLLWRRHVAVVADADKGGTLSPRTPVIHTVAGTPELEALGEMGFGFPSGDFEVRRPKWQREPKAKRPRTTSPSRSRPTSRSRHRRRRGGRGPSSTSRC